MSPSIHEIFIRSECGRRRDGVLKAFDFITIRVFEYKKLNVGLKAAAQLFAV